MNDLNRRELVKLAAGLTVATVGANEFAAQEKPKRAVDEELRFNLESLGTFMFAEQATTKVDDTGHSRDFVITSAIQDGEKTVVAIRSNQVRIFRANPGVDEFTKAGGMYWRFGDTKGKVQFKTPGSLVMVIRDDKGTVNWYSLTLDFRC